MGKILSPENVLSILRTKKSEPDVIIGQMDKWTKVDVLQRSYLINVPLGDIMLKGKSRTNLSIIDKDLKIDGSLTSRGKLIIKGSLKGTIDGEIVVIAKEGIVDSDAKVSSMTIGGSFKGEITASKELIILSTGRCEGKVACKDLIVENGGILNAEVTCIKSDTYKTLNTKNAPVQSPKKNDKSIEL